MVQQMHAFVGIYNGEYAPSNLLVVFTRE